MIRRCRDPPASLLTGQATLDASIVNLDWCDRCVCSDYHHLLAFLLDDCSSKKLAICLSESQIRYTFDEAYGIPPNDSLAHTQL